MNKVLVWGLLLAFISCTLSGDDPITNKLDRDWRTVSYKGKYGNYRYTQEELPDAVNLFEIQTGTKYTGTDASPNVIVYSQGGPREKLKISFDYEDIFDKLSTKSDWQVVKVSQKQILYLSEFTVSEITANEGAETSAWSSAALFKVAKYWNTTKGKKVYIVTHSYGSFLSAKMLADWKYEDYVEKVLILAGRLQMPSVVYDVFAAGNIIGFKDSDGDGLWRELGASNVVNRAATDAHYSKSGTSLKTETQFFYWTRNAQKLQSGGGQFDYIDIFQKNSVPLTKVLFASGKKDSAVGYFTETEINFAKTNANYQDSEGRHSVAESADLDAYVKFLK